MAALTNKRWTFERYRYEFAGFQNKDITASKYIPACINKKADAIPTSCSLLLIYFAYSYYSNIKGPPLAGGTKANVTRWPTDFNLKPNRYHGGS